jgi:hypothetical protein
MPDPETAACVTEKPTFAAGHTVQPAAADSCRYSPGSGDKGVSVRRGSSGVEHAEQIVLEDHLADTQRSEPARDLLSKGSGLLAGHRKQGQRRPFGASQASCGLLRGEPYRVRGLADACRRRIPAAGAAVAACAPRKVERDSAGAGAARIDGQEDLFQFGLISCAEER